MYLYISSSVINHTHTHTYIYIYICVCVCVCVCLHTACCLWCILDWNTATRYHTPTRRLLLCPDFKGYVSNGMQLYRASVHQSIVGWMCDASPYVSWKLTPPRLSPVSRIYQFRCHAIRFCCCGFPRCMDFMHTSIWWYWLKSNNLRERNRQAWQGSVSYATCLTFKDLRC